VVGVRGDPAVAAGRELARGSRVIEMAVSQATVVHEGMQYDVEVDTTTTKRSTARVIATYLD